MATNDPYAGPGVLLPPPSNVPEVQGRGGMVPAPGVKITPPGTPNVNLQPTAGWGPSWQGQGGGLGSSSAGMPAPRAATTGASATGLPQPGGMPPGASGSTAAAIGASQANTRIDNLNAIASEVGKAGFKWSTLSGQEASVARDIASKLWPGFSGDLSQLNQQNWQAVAAAAQQDSTTLKNQQATNPANPSAQAANAPSYLDTLSTYIANTLMPYTQGTEQMLQSMAPAMSQAESMMAPQMRAAFQQTDPGYLAAAEAVPLGALQSAVVQPQLAVFNNLMQLLSTQQRSDVGWGITPNLGNLSQGTGGAFLNDLMNGILSGGATTAAGVNHALGIG